MRRDVTPLVLATTLVVACATAPSTTPRATPADATGSAPPVVPADAHPLPVDDALAATADRTCRAHSLFASLPLGMRRVAVDRRASGTITVVYRNALVYAVCETRLSGGGRVDVTGTASGSLDTPVVQADEIRPLGGSDSSGAGGAPADHAFSGAYGRSSRAIGIILADHTVVEATAADGLFAASWRGPDLVRVEGYDDAGAVVAAWP